MRDSSFSLMSMLFPNRTREQIKGKFRIEERNNPKKVETFLSRKTKFDVDWMEKVQSKREKEQKAEIEALEAKRGRPRQEYEGTPTSIPSVISTPARKASLSSPVSSAKKKGGEESPRKTTSKKSAIVESPLQSSPLRSPARPSPRKRPVPMIDSSPEKSEAGSPAKRRSPRKTK